MNIKLTIIKLEYLENGEFKPKPQAARQTLCGRYRAGNLIFVDCPDKATANFWVQFKKVRIRGYGLDSGKKAAAHSAYSAFGNVNFFMDSASYLDFEMEAALMGSVETTLAYEITAKRDWPWAWNQ